jgi:acyl-CoA dehydrogenase
MQTSPLNLPRPTWWSDDLDMIEDHTRKFLVNEFVPHVDAWSEAGIMPREKWNEAGDAGLLCPSAPEAYGGMGGSFAHEAIISYELAFVGLDSRGWPIHSPIVMPYLLAYGTEEQKKHFIPKMVSGEAIGALAMTEPGAGSDLQGMRTRAEKRGNGWVVNGSKTFITNGQHANLILVAAKTDPAAGAKGVSLLIVDTEASPGFRRGKKLKKLGMDWADTSELFFDDVVLPADALLGPVEGQGFVQMMEKLPQERLTGAICAMGAIERALALTIDYLKERKAFGKRILDFENTQFELAEMKTEATMARVFVDHCTDRLIAGTLDTATASMAKYKVTDLQCEIVDRCLQLFGGYGFMDEYPISRMYRDARVQRIYAGTNEIMKVLIARTL